MNAALAAYFAAVQRARVPSFRNAMRKPVKANSYFARARARRPRPCIDYYIMEIPRANVFPCVLYHMYCMYTYGYIAVLCTSTVRVYGRTIVLVHAV